MSDIAIKVEGLSKQYRLGEVGTGTISHDLNRWWARVRGKEDPFLKLGEANDRTTAANSDYVWALRDINFEVKQGEVLGIIGRNGAGKSTLLKILSKTTTPTTGAIKVKGRIASLLEVGTGFHPEMTGRENIFLNGAILGMTRKEIRSKFDEIVDFAGVERYVDTPVKRYSSGMYVRLAFAVAAHLEPEILVVDEVLAVGDAEFQKKCLGKMKDVSVNDGRTVLFVSHNMEAIKNLCDNALLLSNGGLIYDGLTASVLVKYLELQEKEKHDKLNGTIIQRSEILKTDLEIVYNETSLYSDFDIRATMTFQNSEELENCYVNFVVEDDQQNYLIHHRSDFALENNPFFSIGRHMVNLIIPNVNLKAGVYRYWFRLFCKKELDDVLIDSEKISFEIKGKIFGGIINGKSYWEIK
ncbi:MAG: ABC transporter ATP-binding protein [Bacteroidetes bacterium]|nr:ABC transporter ATP-binding protein [Bacteroidota bacterium]